MLSQYEIKPYRHDHWEGSLESFFNAFGVGLGCSGDLNNDGIPDIYVMDSMGTRWDIYLNRNGTFLGNKKITSPVRNLNNYLEGNNWRGFYISEIGDINSDGISDVAICENAFDESHPLWICLLDDEGVVQKRKAVNFEIEVGKYFRDEIYKKWNKASVISAGDIYKEGRDVIAVGDFMHENKSTGKGVVWLMKLKSRQDSVVDISLESIIDSGTIHTDIKDETSGMDFRVYPNPCRDLLNLEVVNSSDIGMEVSVFDNSGKVVFVKKKLDKSGIDRLNLSPFPNGIYFVSVMSEDDFAVEMVLKSD